MAPTLPRNIPGYHYDEATGKYFKTLPNHLAPQGSQHSRQAVSAKCLAEGSQRREDSVKKRRRQELVRRGVFSKHVRLSLLGRLGVTSFVSKDLILQNYARELVPVPITPPFTDGRTFGSLFTIDAARGCKFLPRPCMLAVTQQERKVLYYGCYIMSDTDNQASSNNCRYQLQCSTLIGFFGT